jgi:arsenical pump membrane protein
MLTMDPLALLVSAAVLAAVLAVAAVNSERVRPAYVAVPGAIFLVLVGALRYADAEGAVRQIAPTVGFLVVVLLLAHLADREGLFSWAAAVTARLAGQSAGRLFVWVVVLCATVTAVLSLDATVVLLTPWCWPPRRGWGCQCGRTPTPRGTWPTQRRCCCRCRT